MEPLAPGTEDDLDTPMPNKKATEQERLLSLKTLLPNGQYGNVFDLTFSNGTENWYCSICECPIMGRVFYHENGKRHTQNMQSSEEKLATCRTFTPYQHHIKGDPVMAADAQSTPQIKIAPGEPVPPGFEGEITKVAQIQSRLDLFKSGALLGLEYLLELQDYDSEKEPSYLCLLCNKKGDPRTVIAHLVSYNHIQGYLQRHFPKTYQTLAPFVVRQYKKNWQDCMNHIAEAIEARYGRLCPHPLEADTFESKKEQLYQMVHSGPHFSEKNGVTFVHLVNAEELTKACEEDTPIVLKPSTAPSTMLRPQKKRSPSPPVVKKPKKPKTNNVGAPTNASGGTDDANRRKRSLSSASRSSSGSDGGGSRSRSGGRPLGGGSYPPNRRRRSRSRSSGRGRYPPRSPQRRGWSKADEFRRLSGAIERDMSKLLKQHMNNPEKHHAYNEEWKIFWNKRYKELQTEGKDTSTYDFKPEWIVYWNQRVEVIHKLETENKIEALRRRLGMPSPPPPKQPSPKGPPTPICFKIGPGGGGPAVPTPKPAPTNTTVPPKPANSIPVRRQPEEVPRKPVIGPNVKPMAAQPDQDHEVIVIDDKEDRPPISVNADTKRGLSPRRGGALPFRRSAASPSRRGGASPPRRSGISPSRRGGASPKRIRSPLVRKVSPLSRKLSPKRPSPRRRNSPPRRICSPGRLPSPRRIMSNIIRTSPTRHRNASPTSPVRRRNLSPTRPRNRSKSPPPTKNPIKLPYTKKDARSRSPWEDEDTDKNSSSRNRNKSRSPDRARNRTREEDRSRARELLSKAPAKKVDRRLSLDRISSGDERELEEISQKSKSRMSPTPSYGSSSRDMYGRSRELSWDRDINFHKVARLDDPYKPPPYMRDVSRKPVGYNDSADAKDEEEVNIVGVLRILTALEERLGSLGPKIIDMLATALAMEKKEANTAEKLLENEMNCVLFETVKEKLKGQLHAGLVGYAQEKAFKIAIRKIATLLHVAGKRKEEMERKQKVIPVQVPGVGNVDKSAIAKQIATALVLQGKTDVTQAELEQLINAVVGMAQASKNSDKPMTTAAFLQNLTQQSSQPAPEVQAAIAETSNKKSAASEKMPAPPNQPENVMDGLSDSDLQTLLQNFKDLSTEEQHGLINYLKKLEAKEPERVEKLRKFVSFGQKEEAKERHESPPKEQESTITVSKAGRVSPFSIDFVDREKEKNESAKKSLVDVEYEVFEDDPKSDEEKTDALKKKRKAAEEKREEPKPKVKIDSDDEEYSYEDVFKAANKNVEEKKLEEEKKVEESKNRMADFNLTDAKALIANLMGTLATKGKDLFDVLPDKSMLDKLNAAVAKPETDEKPAEQGIVRQAPALSKLFENLASSNKNEGKEGNESSAIVIDNTDSNPGSDYSRNSVNNNNSSANSNNMPSKTLRFEPPLDNDRGPSQDYDNSRMQSDNDRWQMHGDHNNGPPMTRSMGGMIDKPMDRPMGGMFDRPMGSVGDRPMGDMPMSDIMGDRPMSGMKDRPMGGMEDRPMGGMEDRSMGGMGDRMSGMGDRSMGGMGDRPMGGMGDRSMGGMGDRPMGGMGDRSMGGMGDRSMGGMRDAPMGDMGDRMSGMGDRSMGSMRDGSMGGMGDRMGGMGDRSMSGMGDRSMGSMGDRSMGGMGERSMVGMGDRSMGGMGERFMGGMGDRPIGDRMGEMGGNYGSGSDDYGNYGSSNMGGSYNDRRGGNYGPSNGNNFGDSFGRMGGGNFGQGDRFSSSSFNNQGQQSSVQYPMKSNPYDYGRSQMSGGGGGMRGPNDFGNSTNMGGSSRMNMGGQNQRGGSFGSNNSGNFNNRW